MNYNSEHHHRKSIRLKEYDYTNPNWYFITICVYDKSHHLFGSIENGKMILNEFGKIVEEEWLNTKQLRPNIDLDYYVVMPNHFHGILIIDCRGELHSPQKELHSSNEEGRIQYAFTSSKTQRKKAQAQ